MDDAQIKHMVDRFLGWRLPSNFNPDAGISFELEFNKEFMAAQGKPPSRHEPVGTNLFDAEQAEAMVRYMIEGMPVSEPSEGELLRSAEYARLCGIAAAASALASVYPSRCTGAPLHHHPENCSCGQVVLENALRLPNQFRVMEQSGSSRGS